MITKTYILSEIKKGNKERKEKKVKAAKCKSSNEISPLCANLYFVNKTTLEDQ